VTISEILVPEFDNETQKTRRLLEVVPFDDPEWKPHQKSMSIGRLAGHVADLLSWAGETVNKPSLAIEPGGYEPFHPNSTKELLEVFDARVAEARAAISGASDDHLQHIWTLSFGDQKIFSLPRFSVLRSVVMNHMIHHRGQLSVYLRLRNVPVPGMYGPSADEK
jgi:uncharacterized damage-inducible protein DinB